VCCIIFIGSCTHESSTSTYNEIVFKSVNEKEYQEASPFTKKLIDKIDASINVLNIFKKDSSVEYEAYLWISMDEKMRLYSY
jgi:hypothetical protein